MSEFDAFFERERENSLVSRFSFREPLSLGRVPAYLKMLRKGIRPRDPFWRLQYRLISHPVVVALENKLFQTPLLCAHHPEGKRHFSPSVAHDNFKTLDRGIVNYRFGNEPELAHLIDLLVPDDGVMVDVGANWGYFSFYLYFRENFKGRIHSFEPLPENYTMMTALKQGFGVGDRLQTHDIALSDAHGTAQFFFHPLWQESATLKDPLDAKDPSDNPYYRTMNKATAVRTAPLDAFAFDRMDFLKIDVEGFEAECLAGAKAQIETFRPYIFLESHYSAKTPEAAARSLAPFDFLGKLGYRFFLPSWVQNQRNFFVGIGWDFAMKDFALTPFQPQDRKSFGIEILNIFACPAEKTGHLGAPFADYFRKNPALDRAA